MKNSILYILFFVCVGFESFGQIQHCGSFFIDNSKLNKEEKAYFENISRKTYDLIKSGDIADYFYSCKLNKPLTKSEAIESIQSGNSQREKGFEIGICWDLTFDTLFITSLSKSYLFNQFANDTSENYSYKSPLLVVPLKFLFENFSYQDSIILENKVLKEVYDIIKQPVKIDLSQKNILNQLPLMDLCKKSIPFSFNNNEINVWLDSAMKKEITKKEFNDAISTYDTSLWENNVIRIIENSPSPTTISFSSILVNRNVRNPLDFLSNQNSFFLETKIVDITYNKSHVYLTYGDFLKVVKEYNPDFSGLENLIKSKYIELFKY